MIEVTDTADRLTIEDGNVRASVLGTLVVIVIAGGGLIGCSLAFDFHDLELYRQNLEHFRKAGFSHPTRG